MSDNINMVPAIAGNNFVPAVGPIAVVDPIYAVIAGLPPVDTNRPNGMDMRDSVDTPRCGTEERNIFNS
jgi:hypothetical protein